MQEFNLADIRAIFLIKGHGIFRQSDMLNSMRRAYFSDTIVNFLAADPDAILGRLSAAQGDVDAQQSNAWNEEIRILKSSLLGISGQVYVEFSIPRMGKRVDAIVIAQGIIFPIEFKVFSDRFDRAALDQVMDYALDLKNFHEQSHDKTIIPILVATNATPSGNILTVATDDVYEPMKATAGTLRQAIVAALDTVKTDNIDVLSSLI